MAEVSIRRLSIPDHDEEALRRLIAHGEILSVERKEAEPRKGVGPAVASFANPLGGWLLLGVSDAGEIVGFEPGSGDFTDKMRPWLRSEAEALPRLRPPSSPSRTNRSGSSGSSSRSTRPIS